MPYLRNIFRVLSFLIEKTLNQTWAPFGPVLLFYFWASVPTLKNVSSVNSKCLRVIFIPEKNWPSLRIYTLPNSEFIQNMVTNSVLPKLVKEYTKPSVFFHWPDMLADFLRCLRHSTNSIFVNNVLIKRLFSDITNHSTCKQRFRVIYLVD